jgi:hypothetical protein
MIPPDAMAETWADKVLAKAPLLVPPMRRRLKTALREALREAIAEERRATIAVCRARATSHREAELREPDLIVKQRYAVMIVECEAIADMLTDPPP